MMNFDGDVDTRLRLLRESEARGVEASNHRRLALKARSEGTKVHDVSSRPQKLLVEIGRSFHLPGIRAALRLVHRASQAQDSSLMVHPVAGRCDGSYSHGLGKCPH